MTVEPLIGVLTWPGAVSSYRFGGAEQSPTVSVSVSVGTEGLPGPLAPPGAAATVAARYQLICSQLDQPELTVSLLSTLNPDQPLPVADGASALRRFAAAAELVTMAAATVTPPDLKSLGTLDKLMDGYGVLAADLATANAGRPLNGLLAAGQPLAMRTGQLEPDLVPSDASSLAEVAARLGITPEQLLEDNRGLLLAVEPSVVLPGIVALPAEATLSRPLAVLAGDAPLTAAEVQAQHGCPAEVFAALNAAVLGVLQPEVLLTVAASTITTAEHDTLNAVLSRLAAEGLSLSVAELLAATASIPLFRAGARVLLPPAPVPLTASGQLVGTFAAPAFELAVTLRLERPAVAETPVTPDLAKTPVDPTPAAVEPMRASVERADSAVPAPTRDEPAFEPFIDACLDAVPSIRLATRTTASQAAVADEALWAIAFGSQGISSLRLQPAPGHSGARFLAPRPLYPEPLRFDAPISELTALGTLGQPAWNAFSGVDTEPWARRFLIDLDRYLDAPFATLLSETAPDALLAARGELAGAIAAGVGVVLAPDLQSPQPTPAWAAGLASAQAALAEAGRGGSVTGYGSVAVQHAVAAETRFEPGQAARLAGVAHVSGSPYPSVTDLSLAGWSTFALDASRQDTAQPADPTSVALLGDQVFDALTINPSPATGGDRIELSFVRPLGGDHLPKDVSADLGAIELPLVHRLRPAPPVLRAIAAQPSWNGPGQPTVAQAAGWTLAVSYSHEHAAHDEVRVSIWHPARRAPGSPDVAGSGTLAQAAPLRAGTEPDPALAIALARYLAVADQLAALLDWYAKPPQGSATATARGVRENALATLAELTRAVVDAWAGHTRHALASSEDAAGLGAADADAADAGANADATAGAAGDSDAEERREYRLRACYTSDGERRFERLVVSRDAPADDWPAISWHGDAGQPLTPGPVANGQRSYTPARPIAAAQPLIFQLELAGLDVISQQTARAGVSVSRNAVLREGLHTCPEFVLTSDGPVSNSVSPTSAWPEPIALSGASLAQALQTCFDTLFGPQPAGHVRVDISFSYLIDSPAGADDSGSPELTEPALRAVLPVASLPVVPLAADLAARLADAAQDWRRQAEPPTHGAEWYIGLALLSPRPGEPPLLAFDRLVFAES